MKSNYTKTSVQGFTLVELLVTITLIVVLASFTLMMVNRGGVQSKLAVSVSRARAMGPMVHNYSQDNGGRLPVWNDGDTYWWAKLANPEEIEPESVFKSPNDKAFDRERVDETISYGWNAMVMGRSTTTEGGEESGPKMLVNFSRPEKTLVLADGAREGGFGLIEPSGPLPDPERYAGKVASLMLDGSARVLNARTDFNSDSEWFKPENPGSEGLSGEGP